MARSVKRDELYYVRVLMTDEMAAKEWFPPTKPRPWSDVAITYLHCLRGRELCESPVETLRLPIPMSPCISAEVSAGSDGLLEPIPFETLRFVAWRLND